MNISLALLTIVPNSVTSSVLRQHFGTGSKIDLGALVLLLSLCYCPFNRIQFLASLRDTTPWDDSST